MWYFLYSVLFALWIVVMAPWFLYQAWRHGKYLPALRQRMGHLPETLPDPSQAGPDTPTIWIHSCSVGETLSVVPLAAALHEHFPNARLVFSTITRTGQAIAQERFAGYGAGNTFYFPIDLAFIVNRVLDRVRPALIVMIDTEVWPHLLRQARRRGIPVALCNGRISAESFQWYRWVALPLRQVFACYAVLMMKSHEDAARALRLGAPPERTVVSGNIKYDREGAEIATLQAQTRALDDALGLSSRTGCLIVAGSTHPGEEAVLLAMLKRLRAMPGRADTSLMLAPRHPERFHSVAELARRAGFAVQKRSERASANAPAGNFNASGSDITSKPHALPPVVLLDSLGELAAAYGFADAVFVGGTLIPHGGQSIMEPALHARAIVVGPSMDNFPGIIDDFRDARALVQIPATERDKDAQERQLTEAFASLLADDAERARMGNAARAIFDSSQGAARFTVNRLAALLERTLHP